MCVNQLVQIGLVFLCLSTLGVLCSRRDLQITYPPKNHTVMIDRRLKLFCKPSPYDNVRIKWFHNGEQMPTRGRFYAYISGGMYLRFTKVKVVHRGQYKCRVYRDDGGNFKEIVESEPAYLVVHAPVVIVSKNETNRTKEVPLDSTVTIVCKVAGIPMPVVRWKKNGQLLTEEDYPNEKVTKSIITGASLELELQITVQEPAVYTCFAMNYPIGGPCNDSMDISVILQQPNDMQAVDDVTPTQPQHACAPYKGSFCKEFLRGRVVYHTNLNRTTGLGDTESVVASIWQEVEDRKLMASYENKTREGFCSSPARRLLCHVAFPDCDNNDTGQPLSICRESCLSVKTLFCFSPWAELDEIKGDKEAFKNKGALKLPNCTVLPSKWDPSETCIESDHHAFSPSKVTDSCYVDYGRWYNGTVNVTKSGLVCQAWNVNYPRKHQRSPLLYPELVGAENFCRNPGAEEARPWCYTMTSDKRWEFCNVAPCGMTTTLITTGGKSVTPEEDINIFILIVSAASIVCVILLIAIPLIICRRRTSPHYNATPQDDMEIDISNVPVNSAYHQMKSNRLDPKLETLEFPRNDIEYIRDLGQGAFGRVFQARLICSNGNSHITGGKLSMSGSKYSLNWENKHSKHSSKSIPTSNSADLSPLPKDCNSSLLDPPFTLPSHRESEEVARSENRSGQLIAVKMLKEDASDVVQADFEREASLMVNFDHPNIVRLLGVCTVGKPMCLLFEFMSKGDLNEFLRQCSFDQCLIPRSGDMIQRVANRTKLSVADQLSMAGQIASGMSYLSDRGYVHRDLATRNCLVSCGLIVKIADFGLARSVHSMNYYRGSDKDAIPIRWMPPEAILYNKFSSQSDVWSFGVLLWEIFSYALQPYYGMTHEEVINYLCDNKVLQSPDSTPPPVYNLMKSCWRRKPKERPNFSFLHRSITVMCEDRSKSGTQQSLNV